MGVGCLLPTLGVALHAALHQSQDFYLLSLSCIGLFSFPFVPGRNIRREIKAKEG